MAARFVLCSLLAITLFTIYRESSVQAASNCHIGRQCQEAPIGYYKTVIDFTATPLLIFDVCCPGSTSKYFRSGSFPKPWCRCVFEEMKTTSCWKGEQCCECPSAGTTEVNGLPVCCSQCRSGILVASNSSCIC